MDYYIKELHPDTFKEKITLECNSYNDLIYIYYPKDRKYIIYSNNFLMLQQHKDVPEKFELSDDGMSFLLQSGLIPPPQTELEDIYVIYPQFKAVIDLSSEKKFLIDFIFDYQLFKDRKSDKSTDEINQKMLEIMEADLAKKLEPNKKHYLFHSIGKDSNTVALALSNIKAQGQVEFVTHKSFDKGKDEAEMAQEISKKLRFKHHILDEKSTDHPPKEEIQAFFKNLPFCSLDNITIPLASYGAVFPEIKNSSFITGDGNDAYMGTPVSKRDKVLYKASYILSLFSFITRFFPTDSIFNIITKTKCEWCWIEGFSFYESKKIFKPSKNKKFFWITLSFKNIFKASDLFKTEFYSTYTIAKIHIHKMVTAAFGWNSQVYFPFAAKEQVHFFKKIKFSSLFKNGRNKTFLRELLKKELDLDSDKIGKKGYSFSTYNFCQKNKNWILGEISNCKYFNQKETNKIVNSLYKSYGNTGISERYASRLIYRLFLISLWLNNSKYLK